MTADEINKLAEEAHVLLHRLGNDAYSSLSTWYEWQEELRLKLLALRDAALCASQPSVEVPLYWEYRALDWDADDWRRVKARNIYTSTVDDRVAEIREFIAAGYEYELRALGVIPDPSVQSVVVAPSKDARDGTAVLAAERDFWEGRARQNLEQRLSEIAVCNKVMLAAKAVVDRWDTPLWKDAPHTADSINTLREAIDAAIQSTTSTAVDANGKKGE